MEDINAIKSYASNVNLKKSSRASSRVTGYLYDELEGSVSNSCFTPKAIQEIRGILFARWNCKS